MSAAVMHPTPALPVIRKASVWEKMFSGIKTNHKKDDGEYEELMSNPVEKQRHMSLSTGIEKSPFRAHKRNGSTARKASLAPSTKTSGSRSDSISSGYSRRSSKNWWRSSNPEHHQAPPVPCIHTKSTVFGSHNPDVDSISPISPTTSRRASYVPRNAAGSFLKTTSRNSMSGLPNQDELNEVNRKLSTASASTSRSHQAPLKPIEIKTIELRKDSHVGLERNGLYSMAGICDIIEDIDEDKSNTEASDKSANPSARQSVERTDSAKASIELLAAKREAQREPSPLRAAAV